MKKILLGLVAAFALTTLAAPARAEEPAPAGDAAAKEKPAKKGKKKAKKGEDAAAGAEGGAAPSADKPAK